MDLLKRRQAPILPEAWTLIDQEAKRVLELELAARKLVDFDGPHGWKYAAKSTGRLTAIDGPPPPNGITVGLREVIPLVEPRVTFVLDVGELDVVGRGAEDPDLDAVIQSAKELAHFEDSAVFNGYAPAGIDGIIPSSPHATVEVGSPSAWPLALTKAQEVLKTAGVGGPYSLAAGRGAYDELSAGSEDGYPLKKRIQQQLGDGAIIWAPAVTGAVLVSARGSDYELTVGQDLSIGYAYHERDKVTLFLTESFTFRVLEPSAAVPLRRV